MTEAAQFSEINYPSFFGAIGDKITAAKTAMDAIPADAADAGWLVTNVNQVPILWREVGTDCELKVGLKANGEPFYHFTCPMQWMAA